MNKIFAVCVSILFMASCAKSPPALNWFQGNFDNAVATAGSRLVMVEFFTDS